MAEIDLDALRAARQEASGEPHFVKFGGDRFHLPFEIPVDVGLALADADYWTALQVVLGDQFDAFKTKRPSQEDVLAFLGEMLRLYRVGGIPEAEASDASSKSTGKRSRRTSRATTKSTSANSAGKTAAASVA